MMMRRNSIAALLVVFQVMAVSVAFADSHEDEATLRAMIDELWVQVAAKQVDPADIAPDGSALASSAGGFWQFLSPAGFADLINKAPNTLNFKPAYVEIEFMGAQKDVAYVYYYLSGTITRGEGGVVIDYRTRASNVFEKIDGRWLMAGSHYSPLFGGSGVSFD